MALDPSIILNLGKGVTPLLSQGEVDDQRMQRELGGLKLSQLRQGMQDDAEQRRIAQGTAPEGLASAYYKAGLVKPAQDALKFQNEQKKSGLETMKLQVEQHLKNYEVAGQIMNGVRDQATWERARQQTAQIFGPEAAAQMPAQYDPALIEEKRAQAMSVKQQLEQKWKEMEYTTPNANAILQAQTSQGNNAATIANSRENAQMTDARAREFNATRVEENRLKREAQGSGVKLTEDQGKATGWLVQAENAFKNMQAAGFDREGNPTDAAKPGYADAIAGVPLVGGAVGNWLRTPDRQKFVQGASSLSESLLRAATGAGVNKDEAKQKIEELTPQWGEDIETTKQKMAAIPLYIESLKVRAGPGAPKAQEIGANPPKPVGVPKFKPGGITVTNAEEYAKVPSGATFTTPDGKTRRKP
jgi:hypothetical protein